MVGGCQFRNFAVGDLERRLDIKMYLENAELVERVLLESGPGIFGK